MPRLLVTENVKHIVGKESKVWHNSLLYVQTKISSEHLNELKLVTTDIIDNPKKYASYNDHLAGQLEKEFLLGTSQHIIEQYLVSLASSYDKQQNKDEPEFDLYFDNAWVNLQKKYEFNPVHSHSGDYSYVLWIQIPYNLKDELSSSNCKNANCSVNSIFEFLFTYIFNKQKKEPLYIDKTWEGTLILFPSSLAHCVYPFYTSDDYRISISGNISKMPVQKNTFNCG